MLDPLNIHESDSHLIHISFGKRMLQCHGDKWQGRRSRPRRNSRTAGDGNKETGNIARTRLCDLARWHRSATGFRKNNRHGAPKAPPAIRIPYHEPLEFRVGWDFWVFSRLFIYVFVTAQIPTFFNLAPLCKDAVIRRSDGKMMLTNDFWN